MEEGVVAGLQFQIDTGLGTVENLTQEARWLLQEANVQVK